MEINPTAVYDTMVPNDFIVYNPTTISNKLALKFHKTPLMFPEQARLLLLSTSYRSP